MDTVLIANSLVYIAQFYLALVVGFYNFKHASNKLFFTFVLFTVFQGVLHLYTTITPIEEATGLKLRLALVPIPLMLLFLFLFVEKFPDNRHEVHQGEIWWFILALFLTLTVWTPLFIKDAVFGEGVLTIYKGPLFYLFFIFIVATILDAFVVLVRKIAVSKGRERKNLIFVLVGVITSFVLEAVTQFILPDFFGITIFLRYISLFTLPMLLAIAYAIIGHRILDVRTIPAQVYTLLIWVIVLLGIVFNPFAQSSAFKAFIFILTILLGALLTRNVAEEIRQHDEIRRLATELGQANKKLKELDQLKSQFVSFVSHQLRGPLAIIKDFSEMLTRGSYGEVPKEAQDAITSINQSSKRLMMLVNDFLDLRKIEEGKMDFAFAEVDIVKLIKEIEKDFRVLADEKKLKMETQFQFPQIFVHVDEQRLRQVIQNLLDNAIKYTESGWVRIEVMQGNQGETRLTISDSGRGMSEDIVKTAFDQFTRDKGVRTIVGTGLGLYIAKQIITAHKGRIWAESQGEGKGSVFCIELPKVL